MVNIPYRYIISCFQLEQFNFPDLDSIINDEDNIVLRNCIWTTNGKMQIKIAQLQYDLKRIYATSFYNFMIMFSV